MNCSLKPTAIVVFAVFAVSFTSTALEAQTKQRLIRKQTLAAEFLNAVPKLRDELNTELYKELKKSMPAMKLGGETYYFVEGDRRVNEDQLLLYATRLNHQYAKWRSLQSFPESVRNRIAATVEKGLVSEQEGGKIVRWKAGSKISYCIMKKSFGSDAAAEQRYAKVVEEFGNATKAWTSIPDTNIPQFEHKSNLDGSSLATMPKDVTFAVWSTKLPGNVIASAFFPNDPQEDWLVLIDPDKYFGGSLAFDRTGVLRHELGHVLGFRHEHPRSEAPLVCKTLEVFDADVIPLSDYDPISVMHYFCRGFNNPEQQALNEQRRKLELTGIDKQGARLIYPPEGTDSGFEFVEFNPVRHQLDSSQITGSHPTAKLTQSYLQASLLTEAPNESSNEAESPWLEPQDTASAINEPDLYAWKLFVALNWPADVAARKADPAKAFGENATTVWESWKFSSGANDEVFLANGEDPGPWIPAGRKAELKRNASDFDRAPLQLQLGLDNAHQQFDPTTSTTNLNENHLNKPAFEFIRENELYHIDGQEAQFAKANELFEKALAGNRVVAAHEFKMHFPVGAKEVKAQWREITVEEKGKYYWAEFEEEDGTKLLFGLTALHITTKDIPNWLWATFEHVDNPKRDNAPTWQVPTVDSASSQLGYPDGLGIKGTRWENYRLRGTQVDFVDSFGEPTILANSQIESGFQTTSSCITCHARASIGARLGQNPRANRLSIFKSMHQPENGPMIRVGNLGTLPEDLFVRKTINNPFTGDLQYLQLDFVWSLMRAKRKPSDSVEIPDEVGFSDHISPLFRASDVNSMKRFFDLGKHADVSEHADAILARLKDGSMPCDAPWSENNIKLFEKWIESGKKE